MFLTFVSMNIITLTSLLFLSPNPLIMGILILFLALSTTLIMSMTMSSWLCFLVFLIYISGMLVLFSYFVAITPNMPMPSIYMNMIAFIAIPSIFFINIKFSDLAPMMLQPESYMKFMYSPYSIPVLIFLALILLYAMIVVVKIASMNRGPLRPFSSYV